MSSNEEDERSGNPVHKKKKGHRPCDMCRRKKRRCDGEEPCGHCVKHEFNCTYEQRAMKRTATATSSYVRALETRLKTVEALQASNLASKSPSDSTTQDVQGPGVQLIIAALRGLNSPFPPPHTDDLTFANLAGSLQSLSIDNPDNHGFQGKSSQAMLIKAAVDLKSQTGLAMPLPTTIPTPTKPWSTKPWEHHRPQKEYQFPPRDLAISLISLYFSHVNTFSPLLHRPTFETAFAINTQFSDDGYAATLLLVCAIGAHFSDDPRLHLPAMPFRTAGWKWFDQVKLGHCRQPTLYDLQSYCLAAKFLACTSDLRASWTLVGFGIRMAQDIGAHRIKLRNGPLTVAEELEKRVYWVLVVFDIQLSAALGRSIAIQKQDFDLDVPVMLDDEQPPNTPALVDYFICQLNLHQILSLALKVFYSTNRSKSLIGLGDDKWEEKLVVEFDSALNKWLDSVPEHLRWDPARASDIFFDQSAALYCAYYFTQIIIHRPFIPAIRPSGSSTTFPSLTICNNAARACSHVAEVQQRRSPNRPLAVAQTALFTAGIVLLLNILGGSRGSRIQDAHLSDVHRCMGVLRGYSKHWPASGALLDTLEKLVKVNHASPVRPPQRGHEPSPFVASGSDNGIVPSDVSRDISLGVPRSHSVLAWPVYDPALETAQRELQEMLNHGDGFSEAPARAPQLSGAYAGNMASFPNTLSVPDVETLQRHGNENSDTDMYTDTVAIWSAAPSGFEVSDWDIYLRNVMMQADEAM